MNAESFANADTATTPTADVAPPAGADGSAPTDREETAVSTPPAATDETVLNQQRAYLLQQVAEAPGRKLARGTANRLIGRTATRELGLKHETANQLREALARDNYLKEQREGNNVSYELTEQGLAYLDTLQEYRRPGSVPRTAKVATSTSVEGGRRAYLLFQLLTAEGERLDQREANRFGRTERELLELDAVTANTVRQQLAAEGLITVARQARSEIYELTPAGRLQLGTMEFHPGFEFSRLTGAQLNKLLEVARESARDFSRPESAEPPDRATTADDAAPAQAAPQAVGALGDGSDF